jgi:hypothetical protein
METMLSFVIGTPALRALGVSSSAEVSRFLDKPMNLAIECGIGSKA